MASNGYDSLDQYFLKEGEYTHTCPCQSCFGPDYGSYDRRNNERATMVLEMMEGREAGKHWGTELLATAGRIALAETVTLDLEVRRFRLRRCLRRC